MQFIPYVLFTLLLNLVILLFVLTSKKLTTFCLLNLYHIQLSSFILIIGQNFLIVQWVIITLS